MANLTHDLDLVVPVYNEAHVLEQSITRLCAFLRATMPYSWTVTIADNASTDDTAAVARRLADTIPGVTARILPKKGRGYALGTTWSESTARVRAYLDVDLSTDLAALPALIAPLLSGHSDLAIGTRLAHGSRIVRGPKRDVISRCYNLLLRLSLDAGYSDAQCGFKAITAEAADLLLPLVTDEQWFFDTELLTIAERAGLRIHEVPVDWIDDQDSRVDIAKTIRDDLAGIVRLRRAFRRAELPLDAVYARIGRAPLEAAGDGDGQHVLGQVVRFCIVGGASTLAYAAIYLLLGLALPAQSANFLALVLTAVANTAANRAFTFGVHGRRRLASHHLQGLAVFALSWLLTSSSLALLHILDQKAGALAELVVLTGANLVATGIRFLVFRYITFRRRSVELRAGGLASPASAPTNTGKQFS